MIRPELRAFFLRHSELIAGLIIAALGLWMLARSGGFWFLLGALVALAGLGLAFVAFRRAAFQGDKLGPGLVEVDERQISYFAAYEGGSVSIENLARITALTGKGPAPLRWLLEEDGGTSLTIPNDAAGSEALFDAFSALEGVDYGKATRAMNGTMSGDGPDSSVIWAKPRAALH